MQQKLITFIGGGNMAQAIVLGLLKQGYPATQIIVNDPNEEKRAYFAKLGVQTAENNAESAARAEVVLLAVKPQMMAEVCSPLSEVDFSNKLLISIAAGISTTRLQTLIPSAKSIVRVMPNTPALVGEGMSGLFAPENTAETDRTFAQALLKAIGKTLWVKDENQMHAVTAASGSSPAYFFLMLEAMQQALIEMNINADTARQLVQQSMLGAAKMVVENPQTALSTLRENVTSKGGTTAAALDVFNMRQFAQTVTEAMQACVARSQEMETLF
ncbi:pyrroline-5-carboxylate reductase [Rodentibacter pneumotropicus]|uniref:pyrroline-5-carboxylate reductase n=1 Tax=Rodentibacter pneumotropicus TaxID=758 RepID=UPI000988C068|nr:pyrroline-5-carboxylate reductase [Rodentibacter pneumotropicus]OOF65346.1 pyrroline-5-carboxylate reductase [Rodentibacter pneumotropicus]THA03965.1 pyrroline-5-carboxylate reductase [Rodentibacter pneumotropicus]